MELVNRLQPLDFLLVVVWAAIVGWGLQSGVIRQAGMLIGVYAAAIGAATLYRQGGQALGLAFGREQQGQWEFLSYVLIFVLVLGLVGLIIWRAYPLSRLGRSFGADNVLGAMVAAVWGVMLLIAIITVLRFYAATPWRGQEVSQQGILGQIQASLVAPVLQVVLSPLWQAMAPWFPAAVASRL